LRSDSSTAASRVPPPGWQAVLAADGQRHRDTELQLEPRHRRHRQRHRVPPDVHRQAGIVVPDRDLPWRAWVGYDRLGEDRLRARSAQAGHRQVDHQEWPKAAVSSESSATASSTDEPDSLAVTAAAPPGASPPAEPSSASIATSPSTAAPSTAASPYTGSSPSTTSISSTISPAASSASSPLIGATCPGVAAASSTEPIALTVDVLVVVVVVRDYRSGGEVDARRDALGVRTAAMVDRHDPAVVGRELVGADAERQPQCSGHRDEEAAADAVGGGLPGDRRLGPVVAGVPAFGGVGAADLGQHADPADAHLEEAVVALGVLDDELEPVVVRRGREQVTGPQVARGAAARTTAARRARAASRVRAGVRRR
jgi:hypothetical protein